MIKKCQRCLKSWKVLDKKHHEYVDDANKTDEQMRNRSLEEDEHYNSKIIYHTKVISKYLFGYQNVIFIDIEDAQSLIIYLHGLIYVNEISRPYISFYDKSIH